MLRRPIKPIAWFATTALFALLQLACGSSEGGSGSGSSNDPDANPVVTGDFESANPNGPEGSGASGNVGVSAASDGSNGSTATTGVNTSSGGTGGGDSGGEDPGRLIEEADIVKLTGDRLYAMSRYGGVAAIDLADVDEPKLLGRHRIEATPFEMYVKEDVVFALYQDYGEYIYDEDEGTARFVQTSHVVVIDASEPANMSVLSRFAIPGYISDSRIVGDILYVAAFEDGYCWSCTQNQPRTTVMALNVADPSRVQKVDQLSFDDREGSYGWRRSLTVTDERMYVAGPEWGNDGPVGSTIQVVDISDPTGDLVEGDTVQVAGQVNSRWQMDEYEGVLRVISQPFAWDLAVPPSVETFTVNSADDLEPLGAVALELPRPEQLQSVRFDGERGYAITFERTDPLFTIDLSAPEAPVQTGMLEMPGWLYHMEPRGDRLVGLGFDQDNPDGALAVSLFDVSNLNEPTMIDRANFGGDWGWMVEDQDRIHKAFRLFDEAGLIVMPFNGWVYAEDDDYYCGSWVSGVQLIDWQNDQLTTRGVAEMSSEARRGFLHEQRLLTVSDDRVEVFDISDRDAPARTGNVALAQYVSQTVAAGDRALRVGQNWYTDKLEVDVVPLSEVGKPRSEAGLEVELSNADSCQSYMSLIDVMATEDKAYLVSYGYDPDVDGGKEVVRVATLDLADADAPKLEGVALIDSAISWYTSDSWLPSGEHVVRAGDAIVFNHQVIDWGAYPDDNTLVESGVHVMDLSDPSGAKTQYVELPRADGASALFVDGTVVARSHYLADADDVGSVRFYLDRVDVENPAKPKRLPSLNVPGSVVAMSGSRALTVDFEYRVEEDVAADACYQNARVVSFEVTTGAKDDQPEKGTCTSIVQALKLIAIDGAKVELLGTERLQPDERLGRIAMGDAVTFVTVSNANYYYYVGDCYDCFYTDRNKLKVLTLGGLLGGELTVGRVEVSQGDWYGDGLIVASGSRAIVSGGWRSELTLLDASDPEHPEVVRDVPVNGYVSDLSMIGSSAVVSMGYDGVQSISLED
ncbi:MAG TPA: beta-propeller domain-containing protein [Polyangiaceae bacterium]